MNTTLGNESRFHRFRTVAIWLLVSLSVLKSASFVCLKLVLMIYPQLVYQNLDEKFHRYLNELEENYIQSYRTKAFDPLLGWDNKPNAIRALENSVGEHFEKTYDEKGARTNPFHSNRFLIAAYGGSFVECTEVNDDQTWEYYLSRLTNSNVINFGVGVYGADQAELKLERNYDSSKTNIIILTLASVDVNRITNVFRPILEEGTHLKLGFKPLFYFARGQFQLLPVPIGQTWTKEAFVAGFDHVKRYDYWCKQNDLKPRFGFSYSLCLMKILKYWEAQRTSTLFDDPAVTDRLEYIISRFLDFSRKQRFRPVILFLPLAADMKMKISGRDYQYHRFAQALRGKSRSTQLMIIDLLESDLKFDGFYIGTSHASPRGNEIIARIISEKLSGWLK